jgi:hypothetical protein
VIEEAEIFTTERAEIAEEILVSAFFVGSVVNTLGVLSSLQSLKGDTNLSHIDTKIAK